MVGIIGSFSKAKRGKVLLLGDLLLDKYTFGKARRISPEAPVPVVLVKSHDYRPGGAGNVALNLISLGVKVVMLGRVGADSDGEILISTLKQEGIDTSGIIVQQNYSTPLKNRIIADNQQIVRIDDEEIVSLPEMLEEQLIRKIEPLFEDVDVVAISDYGKGFLSKTFLAAVIEMATARQIVTIVDPKGTDFTKYRGVTLIKPNEGEAYAAANIEAGMPIEFVGKKILEIVESKSVMITRSSAGIALFYPEKEYQNFSVKAREVKDVTGAGDTVLAVIAAATARGLTFAEGAELANIAAGIAVEKLGCARVTLVDLSNRILEGSGKNKVFDIEHFPALSESLKEKPYVLLKVNTQIGITLPILNAIKDLGERVGTNLVIQILDESPSEIVLEILGSMHQIHSIIQKPDSFQQLCLLAPPQKVYHLEAGAIQLEQVFC